MKGLGHVLEYNNGFVHFIAHNEWVCIYVHMWPDLQKWTSSVKTFVT